MDTELVPNGMVSLHSYLTDSVVNDSKTVKLVEFILDWQRFFVTLLGQSRLKLYNAETPNFFRRNNTEENYINEKKKV